MSGAVVLPAHLRGVQFENILASFSLMYALSIVARYKPHRWSEILEGRDSPYLPAIEAFVAISERWWPNSVLNYLTKRWVIFEHPTYW